MKEKKSSKKPILDEFEKRVLHDFEQGKYTDVTTPKRVTELQQIAANTIEESHKSGGVPINIRLPVQDLAQLRERAEKEGLPYQTLARSILHRYVTGQLADLNHVKVFAGTFFEKLSPREQEEDEPKIQHRKTKTG